MTHIKQTTRPAVLRLFLLFMVSMMITMFAGFSANADENIKPKKISAIGKKTITVTAGKELELKVKMTPGYADDDYLHWKIISGSKYVSFDDYDRTDDELELRAKKAGTAKVRCTIKGTGKKVTFTVKVKAAPKTTKKITIRGSQNRTVEVGDDFELKIKKYSGLKEKYLKWKIKDTSIIRFDDGDRTDDEVEFKARRTGKTTITCTNTKTNQSVKFTVTVIPEYDDDYDDHDDYDDDDDDDDYDDYDD